MSQTSFHGRALRVAVIGAGPAGFYTAEELLRSEIAVEVDLYERLFAPYGLVRYGVAPDHQKTKLVTKRFDKLSNNEAFRFLGNVELGVDISLDTLKQHYDTVVMTSGTESGGKLGVSGEDLPHVHHAFDFVNWYNGHPDHQDHSFDLQSKTAIIIGNGNVAIDVARILARPTAELRKTDIPDAIIEQLGNSAIEHIEIVGRRGPVQASFTAKELKEIGSLTDCTTWIAPEELELNAASQVELDNGDIRVRTIFELFKGFESAPGAGKNLRVRFLHSPTEIGDQDISLQQNKLEGEPGRQKAVSNNTRSRIETTLIISCIGYRATPFAGLPFDEQRGLLPNQAGRVTDDGIYAAGWIKRGPSGLIGNNKKCAAETVHTLLADVENLAPCPKPSAPVINKRVISFADWKVIDAHEEANGTPRKKVLTIEEALKVLD